ncbi:hypothetical protein P7K49_013953 [Saguinus oedipus]|uniref:Uncharacterized protein n=1 Tax=Saguinus oedipus TaxID=9490 RepID=A0ABQ9VJJ5_SAGOE|nr:hypothetical protein P7K49_013953 [Saguinus oedipus]
MVKGHKRHSSESRVAQAVSPLLRWFIEDGCRKGRKNDAWAKKAFTGPQLWQMSVCCLGPKDEVETPKSHGVNCASSLRITEILYLSAEVFHVSLNDKHSRSCQIPIPTHEELSS